MTEMNLNQTDNTRTLQSFQGKSVICIEDGQRIGTVEDILVDPGNMSIEGIVMTKGNFLRSEILAVPASEVRVWGQDAVLASRPDVVLKKDQLPGVDNCLSGYDNIPGRDVISLEGDRVGELKDLLITSEGQLTAFVIDRVRNGLADLLDSTKKGMLTLPISTVHSFGKDVLIVDLEKIRSMTPRVDMEETTPTDMEMEQHETVDDHEAEINEPSTRL